MKDKKYAHFRAQYIDTIGAFKGADFKSLDLDDKQYLVGDWLSAVKTGEDWLQDANCEQGLASIDMQLILHTKTLHGEIDQRPLEYLIHRRIEGLCNFFASTIQEHIDEQQVLSWE
jgi:hypothetical protein